MAIRGKVMKQSKRDAKLDSLLGKRVYISFLKGHGEPMRGILKWNNQFVKERFHSFSYYIEQKDGEQYFFKKSYVTYVREI